MADGVNLQDVATLLPSVLKGIQQAWAWRRAAAHAATVEATELSAAQEVALRISGSVLFEVKSNVERIRHIVRSAKENSVPFAPFSFCVTDAMMPRLCEVMPTPAALEVFHLVSAAIRRVDFFTRAWASAPLVPVQMGDFGTVTQEDTRARDKAVGFACDADSKGLVQRFNWLVSLNQGLGEAVFADNWPTVASNYGPTAINADAPVEHSII